MFLINSHHDFQISHLKTIKMKNIKLSEKVYILLQDVIARQSCSEDEEVYNCRGVWFKAAPEKYIQEHNRNTDDNFSEIQLARSQKRIIIMIKLRRKCITVGEFDLKLQIAARMPRVGRGNHCCLLPYHLTFIIIIIITIMIIIILSSYYLGEEVATSSQWPKSVEIWGIQSGSVWPQPLRIHLQQIWNIIWGNTVKNNKNMKY